MKIFRNNSNVNSEH